MLIYDALKKDHREVLALMDKLIEVRDDDTAARDTLVGQVRDALIPHSRAEEAVFYNSIRAVNTAQDLVWHGYAEHMEAEALLRTLQTADAINAEWRTIARKLKTGLEHHIKEEEEKIIPVAEHLFTKHEAEAMTVAFEEMKPEVKEGGMIQSTLDLIANLLPARLAAPLRTFSLHETFNKH